MRNRLWVVCCATFLLSVVMLAGCSTQKADGSAVAVGVGSSDSLAVLEPAEDTVADGIDAPSTRGALHVEGTQLVGENGEPIQLRGASTHGLAWFPQYVNNELFGEMRDSWGANVVRLALYTHESGGYCTDGDKAALRRLIDDGVSYATDNDLYVIIDWHVLQEQNPLVYADEAEEFFRDVSSAYSNHNNVIYEICNEPNGSATWADVKAYAERIIPVIRENDPDAVIIVGTPTWSQDVDQAAADPLDFENIMYTLHFYAATHKEDLRQRMTDAIASGLPIFVTEFGICDASGNGALDIDQANAWVEEMDRLGVSYIMWNLANKAESSSMFVATCTKDAGFAEGDFSPAGQWLLATLGSKPLAKSEDSDASDDASSAEQDSPSSLDAEVHMSEGDLDILMTLRSTWEDNGKTAYLYDLTIRNTGSALDTWSIDIPLEGNMELVECWNADVTLDGTTLHVAGVDYNTQLDAGGTISDIGFIVR